MNQSKQWLDHVALDMLGWRETLDATYDIARACIERGVPGDFVECGVFRGAQCAAMAKAILDSDGARQVHLFDSFEGLPPAAPVDEEIYAAHGDNLSGEAVCGIEHVKQNMRHWGIPEDLLVYHPGWFDVTVPGFDKKIALLRLDGDLYSSTSVCMKHLYPLMSRGGWVIVDDWNLTGTRKAVLEQVVPAPIYWKIPTK